MPEDMNEAEVRFMERIERRIEFLKTLSAAELGIYLPPDDAQRQHAIETVVRMTARQRELSQIRPATLSVASERIRAQFEGMQRLLPNDVQYRNRLLKRW